ncbi:UNVERIFIED_CONTAM: hypothetical protein RMT77_009184 [Armadillidium vulgare]
MNIQVILLTTTLFLATVRSESEPTKIQSSSESKIRVKKQIPLVEDRYVAADYAVRFSKVLAQIEYRDKDFHDDFIISGHLSDKIPMYLPPLLQAFAKANPRPHPNILQTERRVPPIVPGFPPPPTSPLVKFKGDFQNVPPPHDEPKGKFFFMYSDQPKPEVF